MVGDYPRPRQEAGDDDDRKTLLPGRKEGRDSRHLLRLVVDKAINYGVITVTINCNYRNYGITVITVIITV